MLRLAALCLFGFLIASLGQAWAQSQDAALGIAADGRPATKADLAVVTFATTGRDGAWSQVDLIPVFQGNPTLGLAPSVEQQALFDALRTLAGTDLNGDWSGPSPELPTSGFDAYTTGLPPGSMAGFILAANNLYDLVQATTGQPQSGPTLPPQFTTSTFPGFTGGDIDSQFPAGDPGSEGGPGLFSNAPNPLAPLPPGRAVPAKLPTLPNTMGGAVGTSGRGAQADDEHQFIQIDFRYLLARDSLFNNFDANNSFLGDGTGNVKVVKHWVQHPETAPGSGVYDQDNSIDSPPGQPPEHVSGIGVIGGVTAVPITPGLSDFATVDISASNFSHLPTGTRARIADGSVLTYIAYESIPPTGLPKLPYPQPASSDAYIVSNNPVNGPKQNTLILPDPTVGKGGRVFGATPPEVGSVNDFETDGDEIAAAVGFISFEIEWLRTRGEVVSAPYFHSFPMDQSQVGQDARAVDGSFNRGAALAVTDFQVPSIDILDPSTDAIGRYDPQPASDSINTISTRARFRVDFDREVVPNSVGFSRRHTLHGTEALGVVFPFNGNTRPVQNPGNLFTPSGSGSPLAPSVYLAVNQPAGVNQSTSLVQPVASPYQVKGAPPVDFLGNFLADDGVTAVSAEANGLTPETQNQLATLPRGIVPVDVYPLNQNNLQSYVVEPLIELPPGTIVTLGVTMNGLGTTFYGMVNHGNHTRAGTLTTPYQGLDPSTGLGEDASLKTEVLPNNTVVKVNAGPMSLDGLLFYGGTNVALQRRVNGDPDGPDDSTTGGYNVNRSFRVGTDNDKRYINAPVSPQAIYCAFTTGGAGVLDLSGNGYNTNAPGGGLENPPNQFYLESSRFLPAVTQLPGTSHFNWVPGGSAVSGDHRRAFGILGRYTSGSGPLPTNIESDLAVGDAIATGALTPQPGVNEGSSGYETLVRTGIVQGDPASASVLLAPSSQVGIVTDIEVGDFLDTVYFDPENPWTLAGHSTYNTPQLGAGLANNTIADPPTPNPPPLRFPVGLPHTALIFDQADLRQPPVLIEGNEVFPSDSLFAWTSGPFLAGVPQPVNGLIFLNPAGNESNPTLVDQPHLPNPGFLNTFSGPTAVMNPAYVQTGPAPKTSTGAGALLASINEQTPGLANPSGLVSPYYQSRQQIGNFLFLADGANNQVHALNSNTMEILHSVRLPDPYGLGLTPDLRKLFVSNEGDASVSIVDADPTHATFMTELKRVPVGSGPRAVACNPDREDVFVLNFGGNTISILDQATGNVRKTLTSTLIDRPYDMAVGMRETATGPAFQSGTYHGYVSNFGGDNVLVYESGPDGLAGIGFDDIIAAVTSDPPTPSGRVFHTMRQPRGITFDPNAPLGPFGRTIGCYVAHQDDQGVALVSRIAYSQDFAPGVQVFNTTQFDPLTFGDKLFEVTAQYVSSFSGVAFDVALPDYNRKRFEQEDYASFYNLVNAGATSKRQPLVEPNGKFPLADNLVPAFTDGPRWEPDRLYFSVGGGSQKLIEVFDLETGQHLKTVTTAEQVGAMSAYFSQ